MGVTLNLPPALKLTPEQLAELAQINQELQLELTATGALIIMPPTGGETGDRNFELSGQLWDWNRQTSLGKAFDSSTGFQLPNGGVRSPDVSWIKLERWDALTPEQRKKILPLCPDFTIELVSETDDIETTRSKMREYLSNGLRLGWLIDPETKTVEIYRQNRKVEVLQSPSTLSGEEVLPDFILNLQLIW
ncbi:Uma2 family endonuclease [Phormidium pseudopriestleyi FRX01]|uniref:Uma2 family endonuclease n=1 Tax=Phormidium pseudopriestleyi FRX01 TaxID=1759528 RepID=A0ABS3FUQ0_9CYAN|nr:Uma2 family endonuclease [Phormidium pseudopriestleyi]MBO0350854.1 Uma2 family endonuclease [Phormidium pseudopriestleyi FRX01]